MLRRWAIRQYGIADAAVIMAVAFGVSALMGILRQVLIGATFGDGMQAAAYYAAARLPETIINFVAGGALTAALVPLLLAEQTTAAQQRLLHAVTSVVMVGVIVLALVAQLFVPWFVTATLLPGADLPTQALTITLTRILLLQPALLALASIVSSALTAHKRFSLIAVAYVSHNITIIVGILVVRWWPEIGIYGPTVGLVLAALSKLALVLVGLYASDMPLRWHWEPHMPQLRTALWLAAPTALSVSVNYAGTIVDTAFASRIGVTAVAALYSAWLLTDMPARLIGSAIGQAAFPHWAAAVAQQRHAEARRMFWRTSGMAVALTIPVVMVVWLLGRWGVHVVLERGAFDAAAGDRVFAAWQWYIIGLPTFVVTELLSRMLNAMRDTRTPLLTNLGQLLCKWVLLTSVGGAWGMLAVPLAHVLTCAGETVILAVVVRRQFGRRDG